MPMEKEEKTCGTCIYFFAFSDGYGNCRLKQPAVFMDEEQQAYSAFPTVLESEFCGEGCWERFSEITNETESYVYDQTKSTSYWEERILNKNIEAEEDDEAPEST